MPHVRALTPEMAQRLRTMMEQWWAGWTFTRVGRTNGVSRQRAHQILASVGCTARARCDRERTREGADRHRNRAEVAEAKVMVESAAWPRLTVRQRAAVAWLASGLATRAIAARMGGTQQSVRNLVVAARLRILSQHEPAIDAADLRTLDDAQLETVLMRINVEAGEPSVCIEHIPVGPDEQDIESLPVLAHDSMAPAGPPRDSAGRPDDSEPPAESDPEATAEPEDPADAGMGGWEPDIGSREPPRSQTSKPRLRLSALQAARRRR